MRLMITFITVIILWHTPSWSYFTNADAFSRAAILEGKWQVEYNLSPSGPIYTGPFNQAFNNHEFNTEYFTIIPDAGDSPMDVVQIKIDTYLTINLGDLYIVNFNNDPEYIPEASVVETSLYSSETVNVTLNDVISDPNWAYNFNATYLPAEPGAGILPNHLSDFMNCPPPIDPEKSALATIPWYTRRWYSVDVSTVPEPSGILLIGMGLMGLAFFRRRQILK